MQSVVKGRASGLGLQTSANATDAAFGKKNFRPFPACRRVEA